jgi:hypothetical protein
MTAMAFARWGASLHNQVPPGWPASGCLDAANQERLAVQVVIRQASLCSADDGIHGVIDLDRLEPNARYIAWVVYQGNGRPYDLSPQFSPIQTSELACSPADLESHATPVIVRSLAQRMADGGGGFHVDEPLRSINLAPHSYVCLEVASPQWSPVPHPSYRLIDDDTTTASARAVFDLP